jgi:hypothetical protein
MRAITLTQTDPFFCSSANLLVQVFTSYTRCIRINLLVCTDHVSLCTYDVLKITIAGPASIRHIISTACHPLFLEAAYFILSAQHEGLIANLSFAKK